MNIAALDLGTNSFLCLIAEVLADGSLKVLKDESVVVRLGQGLQSGGRIQEEALKRADECLTSFKALMEQFNVQKIQAVATAAAREAQNASDFMAIVQKHQIPVRTLSGKQEAEMSYKGAVSPTEASRCLLIDIGGGSTEYIVGSQRRIYLSQSLPYGAVKLTEKFISIQPVLSRDELLLRQFIIKNSEMTWRSFEKEKPEKILAVAGTPTALVASILGKFDSSQIDGYYLDVNTLTKWIDKFRTTSVAEKNQKYNLGARSDIIFAGTVILEETLKRFGLGGFFVSTKGIRYGLAYELADSVSTSD